MKTWLLASIGVSILAVAGCLCLLILTVQSTVVAIPAQIEALRIDALAEIDAQAFGLRTDAKEQLGAIQEQSMARIDALTALADRQLTGARADLVATVKQSVETAVEPLNAFQVDLQPVLANAAAITKDAQDSWDDSYYDVKGLVASSTVAATQIAQTAETIRQAAPEFLATAQESNRQVAGVVTDIHTVTAKFTGPTSLKTKIWNFFRVIVGAAPLAARL